MATRRITRSNGVTRNGLAVVIPLPSAQFRQAQVVCLDEARRAAELAARNQRLRDDWSVHVDHLTTAGTRSSLDSKSAGASRQEHGK